MAKPFAYPAMGRLLTMLAIFIAALLPYTAHAGEPVSHEGTDAVSVSSDYYKEITFDWRDASGILHTSDLTEEATDTNHIVALLTEVYLNPAVPGYTHDVSDIADGRDLYSTVPYLPCTLPPFNMDESAEVPVPISGATALLVEMKDDYGIDGSGESDPFRALDAIKSVSLISKQMYVGEADGSANPGFLFNVEASVNKFFIVTKGSIRPIKDGGFPLFYNMYEEFSPSNTHPIENAYAEMDAGHQFPVDHNCSTVIGQRHDIIMSTLASPKEYSVNLLFFLPDLRFHGDTRHQAGDSRDYEYYTFYAPDHQPYFFFNKIKAKIDDTPIVDAVNHVARVPVSWVSSYKDITRSKVPEHFLIYRVVDDVVESEPIPADQITVRQDDTALSEDGSLVRSVSNLVEVFVTEMQSEKAREVRYIVLGRREGSEFSYVESNVVTAPIPGYSDFELMQVVIDGHPKSTYDIARQVNTYTNTINLTDNPGSSGKRLLNGHLSVRDDYRTGTLFELHRFVDGVEGSVVVATMEVTAKEPDITWGSGDNREGVHVYDAEIRYPDGVATDGLPLTARFKSRMDIANPENDPLQPIVAVDGADHVLAKFVDRFEVSTERGDHPRKYSYLVICRGALDRNGVQKAASADNSETSVTSNSVDVNIPVRELTVGYVPYTLDQVLADSDASNRLPLNPVGVSVVAAKNPSIVGFEITDVNKGVVVARVTRSPSGILHRVVMTSDNREDGASHSPTAPAYSGKLPITLKYPVDVDDDFALTVIYDNGNTYGNIRGRLTPVPQPEILDITLDQTGYFGGEDFSYNTSVTWTAADCNVNPWPVSGEDKRLVYEVHDYRVWTAGDENPEHTETYQPSGNGGGLSGMELSVDHDFHSHRPLPETPVTGRHIVRLYSLMPSELMMSDAADEDGYVVSETAASKSMDKGTISGVEDVAVEAAEDAPARFYDLLGRPVGGDESLLPAGIYVRVRGNSAEKVEIR